MCKRQEMTKHKAYKIYRGKSFDAIINQLQADPALKDKGFTELSDTLAKLYYHVASVEHAFFWQSLSPKSAGINTSQGQIAFRLRSCRLSETLARMTN